MSPFKIAITAVFAVSIVAGVVIFAMSKGSSSVEKASLLVWGTLPEQTFLSVYGSSSLSANKNVEVRYVMKDQQSFDSEYVEALSEGRGPDVVILRDDIVYKNRNRLIVIPFNSYSERAFKDTFIEGGEIFLSTDGIVAFPFAVDPMVMYWNRDIFANSEVSQPPVNWEQLTNIVNQVTKKDTSGNVFQSAVPFGEWTNVTNAKAILTTLLLQSGTPITARSGAKVESLLDSRFDYPVMPAEAALSFYTQFSNQTSANYTWNRSLSSSLNSFLSGNLAMYFGFSSELFQILQKNSNLNYDVALIPQVKDTKKKIVYGKMLALAISKQSKQVAASFMLITSLTEPGSLLALEKITSLPPVRRDMLANRPTDAYRSIFYTSALLSHSFIDPDPEVTSKIFKNMVESVTSGKNRVTEAVNRANVELSAEFK